jgi:hypothetical protein
MRRLHLQMTEAKGFRIFIRFYTVYKNERLSANILTLHKALIIFLMAYSCRLLPLTIAAPAKQGSPHHWKFFRGAHRSAIYSYTRL